MRAYLRWRPLSRVSSSWGSRIGGRAVRVVRRRRRAGGAEHRDQPQHVPSGVLQAVHGASGKLYTGTRAEARVLVADVELALAVEHVDHLVVGVEVFGRALGRNVADEMGGGSQAGARIRHDP